MLDSFFTYLKETMTLQIVAVIVALLSVAAAGYIQLSLNRMTRRNRDAGEEFDRVVRNWMFEASKAREASKPEIRDNEHS